ncbi:MAG TPA: OmpA family protein [bacterium]|nr:OmpA family protein [bacterium]
MGLFLRRHGRSLSYTLLPALFLLLTVLFIQFTPRSSRSVPGNACNEDADCCTTSACTEICLDGICEPTNVGCEDGDVFFAADGECVCLVDGEEVGKCIQCATDEIFFDGLCGSLCAAGEDPSSTGCIDTQGGCLASLSGKGDMRMGQHWLWGMILMLPIFYLAGRKAKKGMALALLLGLSVLSVRAEALTTSFSVNTFNPTVDDSDYFTVYSSPTMLKRNFHVGFYLDYAHQPYEFGNADFDRTAGVVDHLLTGNIVGSVGVLDWMTVGLQIPIYFWEGLRAPVILGGDENNFDIGDIQLVLKFRLLDRETKHVGIAIVPFIYFPTSSGAGDFLGNGSFAGGAKVVIDGKIKDRVSLALNVGYLARDRVFDVGGNELNDQFLAGFGIGIDILKERLKFIGEVDMATVTSDFFTRRTTPAEARAGFRYTWAHNHDINAGAGFGISNGIGSPDYRLFVGYTYTKRPVADVTAPPPPISEVQVGDELTAQDKIYFEFDKAVIRDISKPTLDKIAGFMKAHPEITKVKIDGYTCDLGTNRYNDRLSQRRAQAAATYLEGQGIEPGRIGTVNGFGEANPLVPNTDEPNREQNRRVQIFVESVNR